MCARFSLFATPAQIANLLEIDVPEQEAQYNIAPTEMVLGAIERNGRRELRSFRWGLIPSWAKDASIGARMINARSETVLDKPAFRRAMEKRRCVIPANGFFEWEHETVEEAPAGAESLFEEFDQPRRRNPKPKTLKKPYFLSLKSHELFGLAGLYEYWTNPGGEKVRSCTVLTTRPNKLVAPLHDRMPVMLRKEDFEEWLDCDHHDPFEVEELFEPMSASEMIATPLGSLVNDPRNKSGDVLKKAL